MTPRELEKLAWKFEHTAVLTAINRMLSGERPRCMTQVREALWVAYNELDKVTTDSPGDRLTVEAMEVLCAISAISLMGFLCISHEE